MSLQPLIWNLFINFIMFFSATPSRG
jgi:hypothetical protein